MFSVRIVTADYYMASPLQGLDICQSPLTQAPVKKVPVVRVFGATPAGKRSRGAGRSRRGARAALPAARTPPALGVLLPPLPSPPPFSPFPRCVTRGAKMWVCASAAPPPPQAGRRRAPSVYSTCGGRELYRDSLSRARGKRAPANSALAQEGPGGRAMSSVNGFAGPRSEVGRWWDCGHPPASPKCPFWKWL